MTQHRNGKTLIELVVVIGTLSTVIVLSARTLFLLMRADGAGLQAVAAATSLARLSQNFREDVHAALDVQLVQADPQTPPRLELTLPENRSVHYVAQEDRIVRTMNQDAELAGREVFRLPNSRNEFHVSQQPPLVTLIHVRNATPKTQAPTGSAPQHELRIEAVPGWDHRFVSSSP